MDRDVGPEHEGQGEQLGGEVEREEVEAEEDGEKEDPEGVGVAFDGRDAGLGDEAVALGEVAGESEGNAGVVYEPVAIERGVGEVEEEGDRKGEDAEGRARGGARKFLCRHRFGA